MNFYTLKLNVPYNHHISIVPTSIYIGVWRAGSPTVVSFDKLMYIRRNGSFCWSHSLERSQSNAFTLVFCREVAYTFP